MPKREAGRASEQSGSRGEQTRENLLDIAEAVIAREGLSVSLREIMRVARVNVTAINYHLGGHGDLLRAIVERRASLINKKRIQLLDEAEQRSDPPLLADIVNAYFQPAFRSELLQNPGWANYLTILSRLAMESKPALRGIAHPFYNPVHLRFLPALRKALPKLPPEELAWRYHAMLAVAINDFPAPKRLFSVPGERTDNPTSAAAVDNFIPMMIFLLSAPPLAKVQAANLSLGPKR